MRNFLIFQQFSSQDSVLDDDVCFTEKENSQLLKKVNLTKQSQITISYQFKGIKENYHTMTRDKRYRDFSITT